MFPGSLSDAITWEGVTCDMALVRVRAALERMGARKLRETESGFAFHGHLLDRRWRGGVLTYVWRGSVEITAGPAFAVVSYRLHFWGNHLVRAAVVAMGAAIALLPAIGRNRTHIVITSWVAWLVFAAIDYFIAQRWFPEELGAEPEAEVGAQSKPGVV